MKYTKDNSEEKKIGEKLPQKKLRPKTWLENSIKDTGNTSTKAIIRIKFFYLQINNPDDS